MPPAVVHCVRIFPLSIAFRRTVTHAASKRIQADPVVLAVELTNGIVGYGETLPRPYVTQETVESVVCAVRSTFIPALLEFHADSFPDALEAIEALPWHDPGGRPAPAARAAVELALLDATLRAFRRDLAAVVRWMGLPGLGAPGSIRQVRFSGVLASDQLATTLRQLRLMYWGGLRRFKLKVGTPGDQERLKRVCDYLRRPLAAGRATLHVDANGAWSSERAIEWLSATALLPYSALEQPLPRGCESALADLGLILGSRSPVQGERRDEGRRERVVSPPVTCGPSRALHRWSRIIVHDESLITLDDARRLIELGIAGAFNIRISKCGGLIPSLRLAALARRHNVFIHLGCMVGETSILSAAGLRFLEVCPAVAWAEGCLGSLLLVEDVVARGLRFGFGGRPPRLADEGLGVRPDVERLERLCSTKSCTINL